ncbi:MAG: sigma-54 dependent transcriptional regulator [Desulfobacterales bacterium]|jgi:two-component system nitrogen regulation response regulator NtrX|nr:sigma-54 dependent transcriptional regulator [Desulfobacterales bacterium]
MYPSILIVDDEPSILQSLSGLLSDEGFGVITAATGYEALKIIDVESPDLVLLDIWMPGIDGIETLKEIKKVNPHIQVIIISGHGSIETAVTATKLGAFDLIEKPLSIDKIIVAINNALNFRRLEEENKYLRKKTLEKHSITGDSPPIQELKKQIAVAAPTEAWILITGENGTGKELVARTIHQLSSRVDFPMVEIHCASIPEEIIESELFGQEKGAMPDAGSKKIGKFELANKGTVFLDEIGDMSLKTQSKLLRILQEQKFQRIGGSRTLSIDVRVIASTNKQLEKEIENETFREDLYYRLNVIPIEVPPLRHRLEDMPKLIEIFFSECANQDRSNKKVLTQNALDLLFNYSWPGNVRELKNLVERLAIMVDKDVIDVYDLPSPYNPASRNAPASIETQLFSKDSLTDAKKGFEREFIKRKMIQHNNNIAKTARTIGVKQSYLQKRLKTLDLTAYQNASA